MTTGERPRLFVAIAPPAAVRSALGAAIDELRQVVHGPMRWVPHASIHLTLKFLGDVDSSHVGELAESLGDACAGVAPFKLRLVGGGTFPAGKRPSVVWTGLGGEIDQLRELQHAVELAMVGLGFGAESRPFGPHLTLARIGGRLAHDRMRALGDGLASLRYPDDASFVVGQVELIRSQLGHGAPRYTTLAEAALGSG
jgi:2'-5' RNA ligase